jgi:Ni/Fe-hydrogenase subunit HybB-like protein
MIPTAPFLDYNLSKKGEDVSFAFHVIFTRDFWIVVKFLEVPNSIRTVIVLCAAGTFHYRSTTSAITTEGRVHTFQCESLKVAISVQVMR